MKPAGRELWEELADRAATGGALNDEERAELRRLAARYEDCAREHDFYEALQSALGQAKPDAPADDRLISRALGTVTPAALPPARSKPGRSYAQAALAVLFSSVAASATWLALREAPSAAPAEPVLARARLATGSAWVNGQRVSAGTRLDIGAVLATRDEGACLELERGVMACASPGSELCVTALGRHQELELSSGRVTAALDAQPAGTRFSVATSSGKVSAVGTVFGVEARRDGGAVVRVEEGAVVAQTRGLELLVREGQQLRFGEEQVEALAVADFDRDVDLLARTADHARNLERTAQTRAALTRAPAAASTTASPLGAAESGRALREPSAAEWLKNASEARARGAFSRAAQHYERLIAKYPSSPEGRAALVALGELELSKRGRPAAALALYERYLAGGGSLAPEARYGKIQALRTLGRSAEERREIEAFLRRHPNSAYASNLTKRLDAP